MVESPVRSENSLQMPQSKGISDFLFHLLPLFRVNWLIHNFLQRDATTRSLHHQSCNLSSKGSLHVTENSGVDLAQNSAGPPQTVLANFNEGARRGSSELTLEHLDESLRDVTRGSRTSLKVPGNGKSARRSSADDVEEIVISQHESSEICLEIPQTGDKSRNTSTAHSGDNTMQASSSDIHYSDRSSPVGEQKGKGNVNDLVTSSLSPSLGAVHIMRPLAGIAWTNNGPNVTAKSRSSLGSFLRPKIQQTANDVGSKSAPSSPVTCKSTKF